MKHRGVEYNECDQTGEYVRLCYQPEISGHVVGFNEGEGNYLVAYTVPYGNEAPVLHVYTQGQLDVIQGRYDHLLNNGVSDGGS